MDLSAAPSADTVAQIVGLSTKKMQQALKLQNSSYADILSETKREIAINRLTETTDGVDDIAFSLGYSDHSNFARAFRKWTGETPASFRKKNVIETEARGI